MPKKNPKDNPEVLDLFKNAGLTTRNVESDLYVQDTPEAHKIIKAYKPAIESIRSFTARDGTGQWLQLPYMYHLHWEERATRNRKKGENGKTKNPE